MSGFICSMVGATFATMAVVAQVLRSKKGITAVGNAQIDTAQSKFGGASALFDGAGTPSDHLLVSTRSSESTGQLTIEGWVRFNALPSTGNSGYMMWYVSGATTYVLFQNDRVQVAVAGAYYRFVFGSNFSTNTWYHIAVVRETNNDWFVYRDGVKTTGAVDAGDTDVNKGGAWLPDSQLIIGKFTDDRGGFNGWMDDLRISNIARYTANFTAPTTPFVNDTNTLLLVHADGTDGTTYFEDDNSPASTATGTAVTFDGTGDYYEATSVTGTSADSNKLLIAGSIYWVNSANLQHIVNIRLGTGASEYGFWVWVNGGRMQCKMVTGTGSNPTSIYENAENSLTADAWNHFVIYWDTSSYTTNTKIYINGVSKAISNEGTTAVNWNWTNTATTVKIGQKNSSQTGDGADFNGRISQLYISNPSSIPDISLFYNQGILDLGTSGTKTGLPQPLIYHGGDNTTFRQNGGTGFSYTLTANGNAGSATTNLPTLYTVTRSPKGMTGVGTAQISTTQSKFSGTSLYAANTSSRIQGYQDVSQSGDFTVECWAYLPGTGSYNTLIDLGNEAANRCAFTVTNGKLSINIYGGSDVYTGSGTVSTNTWNHIAFVRTGTTWTGYLNGVSQGTYGPNGGLAGNTGGFAFMSYINNGSGGYGDEFRISNVARYTAAFTPPTTPFVNDANTVVLFHADGTNGSTVFRDDNGTGRSAKGIQALGNAQIDTAQSQFGGASALFDGTGDYLRIAVDSSFVLGTGDFTYECWMRPTSTSGSQAILHGINSSTGTFGFNFNGASVYAYIVGVGFVSWSYSLWTGSWKHIAFVRTSGSLVLYVDGVSQGSRTFTHSVLANGDMTVGAETGSTSYYFGYIDELRISNTARYSAAFTPTTTAFQNDDNTLFLMHADGTDASTVFIDDNGAKPYTP